MDRSAAEQDLFVVDRVPDDELVAPVPFELERSEWDSDGTADDEWEGRDVVVGYGPG